MAIHELKKKLSQEWKQAIKVLDRLEGLEAARVSKQGRYNTGSLTGAAICVL